jgi:RNA polymerase sigma factor (sigma-70 family)
MADAPLHTVHLQDWLERIRQNDHKARNELAAAISQRIEALSRGLLRRFDNIRCDVDTLDVAQGAMVRILGAIKDREKRFDSARSFMTFAAACIRSELLDLARRYGSAKRGGGRAASTIRGLQGNREPIAPLPAQEDLELWTRFHEKVAELPEQEREVVGLKFYHGWTEPQIAELLEVSERTVRRWWVSASVRLERALEGQMPS